jgi:hypothetical protein
MTTLWKPRFRCTLSRRRGRRHTRSPTPARRAADWQLHSSLHPPLSWHAVCWGSTASPFGLLALLAPSLGWLGKTDKAEQSHAVESVAVRSRFRPGLTQVEVAIGVMPADGSMAIADALLLSCVSRSVTAPMPEPVLSVVHGSSERRHRRAGSCGFGL